MNAENVTRMIWECEHLNGLGMWTVWECEWFGNVVWKVNTQWSGNVSTLCPGVKLYNNW